MQVGLGITVTAADGDEVGTVRLLIVDPATNTLSHVVVSSSAFAAQSVAVPVWAIERAEDGEVSLEADSERISLFPRYGHHPRVGGVGPAEASLGHEPGEFPSLFPEDGNPTPSPCASPSPGLVEDGCQVDEQDQDHHHVDDAQAKPDAREPALQTHDRIEDGHDQHCLEAVHPEFAPLAKNPGRQEVGFHRAAAEAHCGCSDIANLEEKEQGDEGQPAGAPQR